jgi:hypothetical protein
MKAGVNQQGSQGWLPEDGGGIRQQGSIGGNQDKRLAKRLSNQHPVKWVAVMKGQFGKHLAMKPLDRQELDVLHRKLIPDIRREMEFPRRLLDFGFPDRCHADPQAIPPILYRRKSLRRHFFRPCQRPDDGMGIQKQAL